MVVVVVVVVVVPFLTFLPKLMFISDDSACATILIIAWSPDASVLSSVFEDKN